MAARKKKAGGSAKSAPKKKTAAKKKSASKSTKTKEAKAKSTKKAATKKAGAKKAAAKKKAAPKKKAAAKKTDTKKKKPAAKESTGGGSVSSSDINLGHVFALKPRVNTSFRPNDFMAAKRALSEERYKNIPDAARAVAEEALGMTRGDKKRIDPHPRR